MAEEVQKITIRPNGPYVVTGGIPLVRKAPVVSEAGAPVSWQRGEVVTTEERYALCRCGLSAKKPFCDGTHLTEEFDGTETADAGPSSSRQTNYPGSDITVKDDRSICMHAGFCSNEISNVWQMTQESADTEVRAQIIAMVGRCPSGALSYSLAPDGPIVESDLPKEIALTPDGALWASGGIPIERADGQPFEVRNRVTLCRCGASKNKPLCDGTHSDVEFKAD